MNSLRRQPTNRHSGFSLLEMSMVLAIIMILATISFMTLQPMMRQQRINNGYNIVLGAMRQARDNSVAQRTSYSVTFDNGPTPNTITVAPTFAGPQGILAPVTYKLPDDIGFKIIAGIPTPPTKRPTALAPGELRLTSGIQAPEPAWVDKNQFTFALTDPHRTQSAAAGSARAIQTAESFTSPVPENY